jgi:signal transduction histidine kinase/CheY-like chemotaxis protein
MKKLYLVALLLSPLLCFAQMQKRQVLDSLLKESTSAKYRGKSDTNTIKLICSLGKEYLNTNEDSAIFYAHKALQLSEEREYPRGQGWALEILANANYDNHEEALKYFFSSLKIFEEAKDDISKASVLYKTGGIYFNEEKYALALDYFIKALRIYEKAKNSRSIAMVTHSIAGTYGNIGDYAKLLEYEYQALKEFEKNGEIRATGMAYSNIGYGHAMLKHYSEALLNGHKSIRILKTTSVSNHSFALSLDQLASTYLNIAIDSTTVIHGDSLLLESKSANLQKAIQYYSEAYSIYPDDPYIDLLKNWGEALRLLGRDKEALEKYMQFVELRDSFLSRDKLLQVSAEETKRETYLKDKQIEINELQSANKKKERILFLISFGLLGSVAIIIFRSNKRQRQANTKLAKEKVKLEDANERIAGEKEKSDQLAVELQESIIHKDALAEQISQSADMKTRFLANISHELRTPVTLLTGMLELLNNKENGNAKKSTELDRDNERLQVAYNNSRKLQYMVEEILDLSRHETLEEKLNASVKEIAPVLKRMVYAFETFIEKEDITLHFSEYNVQGLYISADENMLEKIVNNLVYNAIKFNEQGGVIRISLFTSTDRKQFIFTINNSGSIISEQDQPHIFERFYQASKTKSVKAEGVGIGLSLVKELTSLMGGTVEVTSKEGAGTTFTLQFPVVAEALVEEQAPEEQLSIPVEQWEHFSERQTVLIVEDNTEMRYYLREVLAEKVNLAEAPNGKKALEWLATNKADLIISDMMMPEMGGEEFVNHLKSNDAYRKIPVVTLTALADGDSRLNMLRLGIDDYIVKPFNAAELRVRVYNLLNNLEERRQFAAKPVEQDDIPVESKEAEGFRDKITEFVLARMKRGDISVYDLAFDLALSERQLYRLSKSLTGCTPAQLIKEVRLQKAYELLLSGNIYKVDDVAKQVGYDDSNYFSRQFLERFGKRPSEFL